MKHNMTPTQTQALAYAEKLVAYHEAKNSHWADRDHQMRLAYNDLCDAQTALNDAAETEAKLWNL